MNRQRGGFTLAELGAVVVIVGVLLAALTVGGARSRRLARLGDDMAHLQEIASAGASYSAAFGDRVWTFSWRMQQVYQTQFPDLNNSIDDLSAQANQMVYLMRTRGGRPTFPIISSFVAFPLYSHLVLADFLGVGYPWMPVISSEDRQRIRWARDPSCFDQGCFGPLAPTGARWPYSASYSITAAFVDESVVGSRMNQAGNPTTLYLTFGAQTRLGPQLLSSVASPAHKVLLHDQFAWHFGARQPYCTHDQARLPLMFVDGSVRVVAAARTNPGWNPNTPAQQSPTTMIYSARPWEPPSMNPGSDTVIGRFRWTRGALLGRDTEGAENQ